MNDLNSTITDMIPESGINDDLLDKLQRAGNLLVQGQNANAVLSNKRVEYLSRVKQDPELVALLNDINRLERSALKLNHEYDLLKAEIRDAAVATWEPGTPQTFLSGLVTIRVRENQVLHFDDEAAMDWIRKNPERVFELVKADKSAFSALADEIEMPADVIAKGDKYIGSINNESSLIQYATLDAILAAAQPAPAIEDETGVVTDEIETQS